MSSGGAGALGQALKIPIVREVVIAGGWLIGMRYAIDQHDWALLAVLSIVGVAGAGVFWWLYNSGRERERGGGGWKILLAVLLAVLLLPLLVFAWRRRTRV